LTNISLQKARFAGANVTMAYSITDAMKIAECNPEKSVIFAGIGFEPLDILRSKNMLVEQINSKQGESR